MLNVPAALRLQAAERPQDRSRLTLNACADQVEKAALILSVALEQVESIDRPAAWEACKQLRQALAALTA